MKSKATLFCFCGYVFDTDNGTITFDYRIEFSNREPLMFTERITMPAVPRNMRPEALRNFLEPLHLMLGISYYKLYCPPKIALSFPISREQSHFWNTVYKKGLGEFLYRNKLNPNQLATFPYAKMDTSLERVAVSDKVLLGIGGGKDSIVAAELLKTYDSTSFLVETQQKDTISERIIQEIGKPSLKIQRMLDPKLFEVHEGSYNGHIPISGVFAFLGMLTAAMYGYKYIVVANEHSSNFGNLTYHGEVINHQWSKSVEFEALLQEYTRKFITPDIVYFSLLRQFHEIRVARMFAAHKKYFPLFASCNRNFKIRGERPTSLWCGECPKCAFVFLILAPFLAKKELIDIFHKNLFVEQALLPLFQDVLGFGKRKPFDCVGTFEESRAALFLASKKFKNDIVIKTILPKIKNQKKNIERVFRTIQAPTLPTPFCFLGIQNVCILGYGKEGMVSEQYVKKNYPALRIGILDQKRDRSYLEKQKNYDLAIKTSGIPKTKVTIPYCTATNIFFSQNKNFTIGVTGSKGKSTTVSLIHKILKTAGKKVALIGNIGFPMLEVLLKKKDPKEIFVIELSSYMLDDIEYAPDIAVLLNLFPDHMNYHGGVENYYKAKERIFTFQKPGNIALRPPFREKIPLKKNEIPLLGAHNLQNIKAAVKVARLLGVSDDAIQKAVKGFIPLSHRLEYVGTFHDVAFYDDAISTTPESTIAAIQTLKKVDTIFLGGQDRGYDFRALEKVLRAHHVKNIVLFPESGKRILTSRKGFTVLETPSMEKAVRFAFERTKKGCICLLSTASPSYSVWKNFEEKGDLFQKLARAHSK